MLGLGFETRKHMKERRWGERGTLRMPRFEIVFIYFLNKIFDQKSPRFLIFLTAKDTHCQRV